MNKLEDQKIYLSDYTVPNYLVDKGELIFKLAEENTRVISKIFFRANPQASDTKFHLDGVELDLLWAKIDGEIISPTLSPTGLTFNIIKQAVSYTHLTLPTT